MADRREILGDRGTLLKRLSYWPCAIPLCAAAVLSGTALLSASRPELARVLAGPAQTIPERLAPFLVAVAMAIYLYKAVVTRNPLSMVLAGLSLSLLLREIHFEWTHRGIYAMLAAVGVWALAWRGRLQRPVRDYRHTSWLVATLWAYTLAFLIYRRAFKHIPGEAGVHSFLEEGIETVAHLMLIATAMLLSRRRYRRPPGGKGTRRGRQFGNTARQTPSETLQ